MTGTASWKLSTRVTTWSVAVGTGFVVVLALTAYLFQRRTAESELVEIVEEELEEMHTMFADAPGTRDDFAECTVRLGDQHSSNRMAWRVWERENGNPWGSFGPQDLVEKLPVLAGAGADMGSIGWPLSWNTAELTDELSMGLLLDGADEAAALRRFALVASAIVIASVGASFLAGRFLGGRIGGALRRIATDARVTTLGKPPVVRPGLPLEMCEIVEVLHETLARIRAESDAARLMASGLAHELRSPLQNLLMQAEVALMRERDPAEYRRLLAEQIEELQELTRAVDNLVTLCAPPEERRAQRMETFDLVAEARLRLRSEEARARRAGVALELHMPERLPFTGDRQGLTLVLRNLLANAIDWSPPAGRVALRLESGARGAAISVEDQGPGVPEAERANIFQAFYRGPARSDGRAGYGLGLALVRAVVDFHGGSVEVATSALGGAAFRIQLPPVSREATRAESTAPVHADPPDEGRRMEA